MATFTYKVREINPDHGFEWEAVEQGTSYVIGLTEPVLSVGKYPSLQAHLKSAHRIDADLNYDAQLGDSLSGQTWTFKRGEHTIIVE